MGLSREGKDGLVCPSSFPVLRSLLTARRVKDSEVRL